MRLLCWLLDHKWMWTVETHHDAQQWVRMDLDDYFYRGVWHERICTRCGKEEAVYQETLYQWDPNEPYGNHEFKPTEHYPLNAQGGAS